MKRNKTPYKKRYTARKKFEFGQPQRPLADRKIPAGVELKCVDTVGNDTLDYMTLRTAGSFVCLNATMRGTNNHERIGIKIKMHSIFLRAIVLPTNANATSTAEDFRRIMIVYDRQPNTLPPNISEIMSGQNVGSASGSTAFDGVTPPKQQRFWILYDNQVWTPALGAFGVSVASAHSVDKNLNAGSSKGAMNIRKHIKLKGLETVYQDTEGDIGDIATGSLLLVGRAAYDTTALSSFGLYFSARLRYWDA